MKFYARYNWNLIIVYSIFVRQENSATSTRLGMPLNFIFLFHIVIAFSRQSLTSTEYTEYTTVGWLDSQVADYIQPVQLISIKLPSNDKCEYAVLSVKNLVIDTKCDCKIYTIELYSDLFYFLGLIYKSFGISIVFSLSTLSYLSSIQFCFVFARIETMMMTIESTGNCIVYTLHSYYWHKTIIRSCGTVC